MVMITKKDAQEYLELSQDIFNDTNHQKIEILRENDVNKKG